MVAQFEPRVLAGDEQMRWLAEGGERVGNRTELDRFWARSNNERNTVLAQLSPWLRPHISRRSG